MLPLSLKLARLNLVLIGNGDACLRRGPEWGTRLERMAALRRHWRAAGADHVTVRRLTAARISHYRWLDHHPIAAAANDRGTSIHKPTGGGVS